MATEKEISSTEKLLDVIRKGSGDASSEQATAGDSPLQAKKTASGSGRGKKIISLGSRDVVGVEIKQHGLSVVKMSRSKGSWKAVQAFSAVMKNGQTSKSPDFPSFLRKSLQGINGIKKAGIWALVPASIGDVWQVSVPRVKKDVYNAVFWSAKKERGFDENQTFFDYRILGEVTDTGGKKYLAEVFTAPRREIDLLKKLFASAGFNLEGITLSSFALQNLFINKAIDAGSEPFAVLSVAQDSSYIDIHRENRLLLSRAIKTGMSSMVEAVLDDLERVEPRDSGAELQLDTSADTKARRDPDQAVKMLARLAGERIADGREEVYSSEEIFDMIALPLERLIRQVERTIDHSTDVLGNPAPVRLYICGSLAAVSLVIDFFQEETGLPIQVIDPLNPSVSNVSPVISSLKKPVRMSLVTAAGLAMSSNEYTPNFLYTALDKQKEKMNRRNGVMAAAILLIAFLITAGYWQQSAQGLAQEQQKTAALRQKIDEHPRLYTMEEINLLAGEYMQKSSALREYTRKFIPVAVMSELTSITPANIRLLNVRLDMGPPGTRQARLLVVEGFITGENINFQTHLSSYLFRLSSSPMFGNTVIHRSDTEEFRTEGQVLKFVINVNLRQVSDEQA